MHSRLSSFRCVGLLAVTVIGSSLVAFGAPKSGYTQVAIARADKIVATLTPPPDPAQADQTRGLIAGFYRDLNAVQTARDAQIKAAKADAGLAKPAREADIKQARADADAKREALRTAFVVRLRAQLTPDQVGEVEDGLTYGVAPLTYRVYLEMLPNLTTEQRDQIHAWLLEARDHAIAGFSSEEKHAWFGKYKGRINNYLAKAGYNMKQAEHDFMARRPAAAKTSAR
ncbi:MAG TPA: DUF3826 domain-containing protein [Opitutaceae bacterium]|nr:DUF3826 domain-containing protein [Opitutaceae bacterium]